MQSDRQEGFGSQGTECFPKSCRLQRRSEFRRVQGRGKRVHTRHFLVFVESSERETGRFGVTVTKKVAHAPGRNRVKRLVREVYRRNREFFPAKCDVVVVAKRGAPKLDYAQARVEFERAARSLGKACAGLSVRSAS